MEGAFLSNLTGDSRFPLSPDYRNLLPELTTAYSADGMSTYGQRISGTITAPVSGNYTFWLSGDARAELWLSSDETPFAKERIAHLELASYFQQWNKYASQVSISITLVEGERYYFEVLHTEGSGKDHVSVAWQYPGQSRHIVPGEFLTSSIVYANDADDDGLPDDWEVSVGLDPSVGYGVNGYAGDLDGDGLLNHEERELGTNPTLADSDGDGFSDTEELYEIFSDPTVHDLSSEAIVVSTINGAAFTSSRGSWSTEGTELYSVDSTGSLSYALNFVEAGAYRLVVELTEQNAYKSGSSTFELRANLDGYSYGIRSASVNYGETAELYYYLPYLAAGNRDLTLDWLNGFGNAFLRIRSVRLERIDGVDIDQNGIADWIESRADRLGSEADLPLAIYASPFCFEGTSFDPVSVAIDSYSLSNVADLREETVEQALYNSYYANIALTADEDRVVLINDQSGLRSSQVTLTWATFNAAEHEFVHIRLDDSLLLSAIDPSLAVARPIELQLTAPDGTVEVHSLAAEARLQALFDQAGDWQLQATLLSLADEEPIVYDSVIRVSGASLAPTPILFENSARSWSPLISDAEVVVESDAGLTVYEPYPGRMPRSFELNANLNGGRIIARLPDGGAILSTTDTNVVRDYTRTQTYNQIVEKFSDGTVMVSAYIILNEVPEGFSMNIQVFKSGVTFDDGTVWRTITDEDFDEQGRYQFFMLRSPGVQGGNCHRYWYLQDDHVIGSS